MRLPGNAVSQTLLYGAGIVIMKGISLLMLPFIAHHLSTEEFGRLEVISTLAVIGSILIGMGFEDTLYRFAGSAARQRQRRRIAAQIFSLALGVGFVALVTGHMLAPAIAELIPGKPETYQVRLVLYLLALEGCIAVPLGWLRMQNRAVSFFTLTTSRAIAQALLVMLMINYGRGVTGILEAGLIAAAGQALFIAVMQIKDTGLVFRTKNTSRFFIYSLPIVGSGLLAFSLNGLDRWILAAHATMTDVAHFGTAAKFALATVLLMQPFGMWWSPRRFEVLNSVQGHQRVARIITLGLIFTLVIAVSVSLAAPIMISWLLPDSYQQAGQYAIGLILIMMLREMSELINLGCYVGATTRSQLVINAVGAAVGTTGMLWLAPQYAAWGLILALACAQLVRLILFFLVSQHYLPLPYPTRSLLLLLLVSTLGLTLASQSSTLPQQGFILLFIGIAAIAIAPGLKASMLRLRTA